VFRPIVRELAGRWSLGRARLQPGHHDPHEPRALAPEGPAYATEKTSAPEIESQRTPCRREQASVFPTVGMRSGEENPRLGGAWTATLESKMNAIFRG
jgi:hypothetical protein